jgi:S1-C subfamily serine protease
MNNMLKGTCAMGISTAILYGHHQYTHSIPFMYNRMAPYVVTVDSIASKRNAYDVEGPRVPVKNGVGTGFIVKGHMPKMVQAPSLTVDTVNIVTNYHVVEDSENVIVRLYGSNKEIDAHVENADPMHDIAFLSVPADAFDEKDGGLRLCEREPVVGEEVIAIGSPYGMETSVSSGIVSGLHRELSGSTYRDMIQTDAGINPGNSGGPLIARRDGCVLGINTATIATGSGIGFAVPSPSIKDNLMLLDMIKR